MSNAMLWTTLVAVCMTFFYGLLQLFVAVPFVGGIVGGLVMYALIAIAYDAADL
jgi:hypothetical protein